MRQAGARRVPLRRVGYPGRHGASPRRLHARRRRPPDGVRLRRHSIAAALLAEVAAATRRRRPPKSRPACSPIAPARSACWRSRSARRGARRRLRAGRGPGGAAACNQGSCPGARRRTRRRTATCFARSSSCACCRSSRRRRPERRLRHRARRSVEPVRGRHALRARSSGWRCPRSPRATRGKSTPTFAWGADRRAAALSPRGQGAAPVPRSAPALARAGGFLAAFARLQSDWRVDLRAGRFSISRAPACVFPTWRSSATATARGSSSSCWGSGAAKRSGGASSSCGRASPTGYCSPPAAACASAKRSSTTSRTPRFTCSAGRSAPRQCSRTSIVWRNAPATVKVSQLLTASPPSFRGWRPSSAKGAATRSRPGIVIRSGCDTSSRRSPRDRSVSRRWWPSWDPAIPWASGWPLWFQARRRTTRSTSSSTPRSSAINRCSTRSWPCFDRARKSPAKPNSPRSGRCWRVTRFRRRF